jgi:DNA-binding transcriptional ArsR family regulator
VSVNVFFAIADPTRRAVLELLSRGSRNAGAIASEFPRLTQPGVSRHLKVLRQAGLVGVTVKAQERIYTIRPEGLAELYEWVAKYQAHWPSTLDALERYLEAGTTAEGGRAKRR